MCPRNPFPHPRVDTRWPHLYGGVIRFVATDCDLGEKVVIREAREREAGREEMSSAERQLVFNGVLSGSRGRGAGGKCRKLQHEV